MHMINKQKPPSLPHNLPVRQFVCFRFRFTRVIIIVYCVLRSSTSSRCPHSYYAHIHARTYTHTHTLTHSSLYITPRQQVYQYLCRVRTHYHYIRSFSFSFFFFFYLPPQADRDLPFLSIPTQVPSLYS